jgi:hypothetical protein
VGRVDTETAATSDLFHDAAANLTLPIPVVCYAMRTRTTRPPIPAQLLLVAGIVALMTVGPTPRVVLADLRPAAASAPAPRPETHDPADSTAGPALQPSASDEAEQDSPAPKQAAPPAESVWMISTRCVGTCRPGGTGAEQFGYWRLGDDRRWVSTDWGQFRASDDARVATVFVVHGNRTGRQRAVRMAWRVLRLLRREAGERPYRMVIWSWPADQIRGGVRRDAQVKARRSDVQAFYLAEVLGRLDAQVPLTAVGYSFGARTITGALHLMAGGRLLGRALEPSAARPADDASDRCSIRLVLVAAAMDAASLLPSRRNGRALELADRVLVTRNSADPVLHFYPLMYGRGGPQAMGYVGPYVRSGADNREKIDLLSLRCSVGRGHEWQRYMASWALRERLVEYAFVADE